MSKSHVDMAGKLFTTTFTHLLLNQALACGAVTGLLASTALWFPLTLGMDSLMIAQVIRVKRML